MGATELPAELRRRYEVLGEISRGGMGVVYRARDRVLGREVALKLIRSGVSAVPEEFERFHREARAAASLDHPNIIKVHDFGLADGQPYLTMYLAEGGSLDNHRDRFRGPQAAVGLMEKVARAVQHAHERGVLHRDLKPHNILLGPGDEPLVADFGLAKFVDSAEHLTQAGTIAGTPAYMAPEQARGEVEKIGAAADVWALGVILLELLTGEVPFKGRNREEVLHQIGSASPQRIRTLCSGLEQRLGAILRKCLDREPGRRHATAGELADDLGRWRAGRARSVPRLLRRRNLLAAGGLLGGAGLLAALLLGKSRRESPAGKPPEDRSLLGPDGPAAPVTWVTGEAQSRLEVEPGGAGVALHAIKLALVELCPVPPWREFHVEAVVQHGDNKAGEVGLYFAHRRHEEEGGERHCFCRVAFSDRHGGWADLRVGEWQRYLRRSVVGQQAELRGNPPSPGFRSVGFAVGPRDVVLFWEGRVVTRVSFEDVVKAAGRFRSPSAVTEDSIPAGGLGLYVSETAGVFQRVTIKPFRDGAAEQRQ